MENWISPPLTAVHLNGVSDFCILSPWQKKVTSDGVNKFEEEAKRIRAEIKSASGDK